jgi:hypothetical protein
VGGEAVGCLAFSSVSIAHLAARGYGLLVEPVVMTLLLFYSSESDGVVHKILTRSSSLF